MEFGVFQEMNDQDRPEHLRESGEKEIATPLAKNTQCTAVGADVQWRGVTANLGQGEWDWVGMEE